MLRQFRCGKLWKLFILALCRVHLSNRAERKNMCINTQWVQGKHLKKKEKKREERTRKQKQQGKALQNLQEK